MKLVLALFLFLVFAVWVGSGIAVISEIDQAGRSRAAAIGVTGAICATMINIMCCVILAWRLPTLKWDKKTEPKKSNGIPDNS